MPTAANRDVAPDNAPPGPAHAGLVLYAAADLLWASKIKATADAIGVACRPVRTLQMLADRLADAKPKAILIDLDKGEEGLELIRAARSAGLRVVAWGPHVAKDLLQAARDQGAHDVMTRGSLDAHMEEVLTKLAST